MAGGHELGLDLCRLRSELPVPSPTVVVVRSVRLAIRYGAGSVARCREQLEWLSEVRRREWREARYAGCIECAGVYVGTLGLHVACAVRLGGSTVHMVHQG